MNSRVYDLGWKLTIKKYHVKVQREKFTIIFRKYKYLQYFIWKYAILSDFDFDIWNHLVFDLQGSAGHEVSGHEISNHWISPSIVRFIAFGSFKSNEEPIFGTLTRDPSAEGTGRKGTSYLDGTLYPY